MASFKTRAQFIRRVLDQLGVLVPGQAPSDELVGKVDDNLDPAFALLAADEIYYVQDAGTPSPVAGGEIDDSVFLPLADCVAWRMAGSFNLVGDPALKAQNDIAEVTLRRLGRSVPTRRLLRCDSQLNAGNNRSRALYDGSR